MIAMTGAMLVYGQVRASVISAIACRTLASAILPEFLTFITRAQPRWCSCERFATSHGPTVFTTIGWKAVAKKVILVNRLKNFGWKPGLRGWAGR